MAIDFSKLTEKQRQQLLSKGYQCRGMVSTDKTSMPIPKKEKPAGRVAECPESAIQQAVNEYLELRGIWNIRFEQYVMGAIMASRSLHASVKKEFARQVGGKLSDNLVCFPVGPGLFLCTKLELKTRDKKGRPVGRTHGKQKHYATVEKWPIARSTEEAVAEILKAERDAERVKNFLAEKA